MANVLKKLLPKNNKIPEPQTRTTMSPQKPRPQTQENITISNLSETLNKTTQKTPRKRGRKPKTDKIKPKKHLTKKQIEEFKQLERENRLANEEYKRQQRRKHAIITNYVKKKETGNWPNQDNTQNTENNVKENTPRKIKPITNLRILEATKQQQKPPQQTQQDNKDKDKKKKKDTYIRSIKNYNIKLPDNTNDKTLENILDKIIAKEEIKTIQINPNEDKPAILSKVKINERIRKLDDGSSKYKSMVPLRINKK